MAQRAREPNPCKHCGEKRDTHALASACKTFEESRVFVASPSSVKTYSGCVRRWAAKALGGIRMPPGPPQIFGENLHSMAEHYLATHEIPDQGTKEGRLFVEGIPHLPRRLLLPHEIEGEVRFTFEGVPWIGYYDWKEFDIFRIGDHKTSSDPKRWGLTAEQLPKDVQAAMYAYGSGWPRTKLRWLYYSKKSSNAYPVDAELTRQAAEDVLSGYVQTTHEMQKWFNENPKTLSIEELNQIPCEPSSCDFVGRGCDFGTHCQLIKPQSLVRNTGNTMSANDRVAKLQARLAEIKAAGTPAVNPPESAAALEETKTEIKNEAPPVTETAPSEQAASEPAEPAKIETTQIPPDAGKAKGRGKGKADTSPADTVQRSTDGNGHPTLAQLAACAQELGLEINIHFQAK